MGAIGVPDGGITMVECVGSYGIGQDLKLTWLSPQSMLRKPLG